MPSFLLIRHAEASWSRDEMRPLSPAGRAAAERLPAALEGEDVEAIYSSPYRRALDTVAPLARERGLPVFEIAELRERALGEPEGVAFEAAVAATYADFDLAHPGGESSGCARERAVAGLMRLAARHPRRPVVVSTHGNLLTLLLSYFDPGVGFAFWRTLTFPDVYRLDVDAAGRGSFERVLPARGTP